MGTTQEWTAPIFTPIQKRDENGLPVLDAQGQPVLVRSGHKKAEITLFDHPVRHRKAGQPDAHARRIKEIGGVRVEEVYLNRSYLVTRVSGTYAGTNARAVFADSSGRVLQQRRRQISPGDRFGLRVEHDGSPAERSSRPWWIEMHAGKLDGFLCP